MAGTDFAARLIAGALPSILLVIAVFVIGIIGLALGAERRRYALAVMGQMLNLAAVLVGLDVKPLDPADAAAYSSEVARSA